MAETSPMIDNSHLGYLSKARERLSWAYAEMETLRRACGAQRMDRIARSMFNLLAYINSGVEALLDASTSIDGGVTSARIRGLRKTDLLLQWMHKARDVDMHHVIRWSNRMASGDWQIDIVRARQIFPDAQGGAELGHRVFLYGLDAADAEEAGAKIRAGQLPDPERLASIGQPPFPLVLTPTLGRLTYLRDGKAQDFPSPTSHLGNSDFPPEIMACARAALTFYGLELSQLEHAAGLGRIDDPCVFDPTWVTPDRMKRIR